MAQREAQIRLLEGQLRQTDVIGSSHNHMILDALREKAECIPELQALIHNVQQGKRIFFFVFECKKKNKLNKLREKSQVFYCVWFALFLLMILGTVKALLLRVVVFKMFSLDQ